MPDHPEQVRWRARVLGDRFLRILLVIVAAGFLVRVAYVAFAKGEGCHIVTREETIDSPSECAVGDQLYYNSAARRLSDGDWFLEPFDPHNLPRPGVEPGADHPPLTIVLLSPVSFLADLPPLVWVDKSALVLHRYEMVLLGSGLVFLIGLLGRRLAGDAAGWAAAGLAAVYPNLWVNDGLIMSETVAGLTVVGALLVALRFRDVPGTRTAAWLGVLCGLAALARAELLMFVPLLVFPVAWTLRGVERAQRWRLAGIATGVTVAVLLPWVVYNNVRFDERTFISTNDGLALAGSNCDPVYYGNGIGLTYLEPPCIDLPPPPGDQSTVSRIYRDRALDYVNAHTRRLPAVVAARVGRTWGFFRPTDMIRYNTGEGREAWVTRLGIWTYYPVLALALAGAAVLWRRSRRVEVWLLVVPAIVVTLAVAATYGQVRFRSLAEPSLVLFAGVALASAAAARRPRAAPEQGREPARVALH